MTPQRAEQVLAAFNRILTSLCYAPMGRATRRLAYPGLRPGLQCGAPSALKTGAKVWSWFIAAIFSVKISAKLKSWLMRLCRAVLPTRVCRAALSLRVPFISAHNSTPISTNLNRIKRPKVSFDIGNCDLVVPASALLFCPRHLDSSRH